jgi:hypothetical protein
LKKIRKRKSLKEVRSELRKLKFELRKVKPLQVKLRGVELERDRLRLCFEDERCRASEMAARLSVAEYFVTEMQARLPDTAAEIFRHHAEHRKPVVIMQVPMLGGVFECIKYEPSVQWKDINGDNLSKI